MHWMLRFVAMTATLALASGCATRDPFPPTDAQVQPISVAPGSTAAIAFKGVVYEIEAGTQIGLVYWRRIGGKPFREIVWPGPANPTQFNSTAERCLKEAGYPVQTTGERLFSSPSAAERPLVLGAIVTRVWSDILLRASSRDRSYQNATIEAAIRLYDPNAKETLYDRSFTGYGTDMGLEPTALPAAFENLLEHALADPAFVESARSP